MRPLSEAPKSASETTIQFPPVTRAPSLESSTQVRGLNILGCWRDATGSADQA